MPKKAKSTKAVKRKPSKKAEGRSKDSATPPQSSTAVPQESAEVPKRYELSPYQ
ncbi:MAG: hypothetical protein JRN44_00920 [Nitrososphaerota archaeon]|nr:hypothetical protein [Nitrososphaerota archaeon]MDG6941759.1 hypothetical protein [Nitrososphaerota archaeon]MDG6947068.1 hypothetical protein [Nitrososphaerota archaeon]MDG6950520.1 hypothetical protein [Nitrososphaerota archaeon]